MELKENEHVVNKAAFIEELRRMSAARKAKEEETRKHMDEMEAMGYDLTDYKGSLSRENRRRDEGRSGSGEKKRPSLHDRTIKKGADLVEHAEQPADGAKIFRCIGNWRCG